MKLLCTKYDFRKLMIACNESTSCFSCAFHDYCTERDCDKGEFIADIVEVIHDEEVKNDT